MAPTFCPLSRNDPHVHLQIARHLSFYKFQDVDEHSIELNRIWKLKHALGCPQCSRYRKHGTNGLCGRCQKLRRTIKVIEQEISIQVPVMLLAWREANLSTEAHKVYKKADALRAQAARLHV